jgi:hypothetical protein
VDDGGTLVFTDPSSEPGGFSGTSSSRIKLAWTESREPNEITVEAAEEVGDKMVWGHCSAP